MLTLFTTAKPFRGHSGVIQRNALKSWTLLHRDIEVILFGNDEGAADAARELRVRHEPHVERNEHGTKRLDFMFARAQALSRHSLLCYCNCDIILMDDFARAVERAARTHRQFLMVGRRWDMEIGEAWNFERPGWQAELRRRALKQAKRRGPEWADYFVFTREQYGSVLPAFVVGRVHWDNWLLWKAWNAGQPVVDASATVLAVHQNHDYGYHPHGKQGVWHGEEAGRNYELAGGWRHLRTIADATKILGARGLRPNRKRYWSAAKRYARQAGRVLLHNALEPIWFAFLEITRPMRCAMGLRLRNSRER